jgi:hypothetical protein
MAPASAVWGRIWTNSSPPYRPKTSVERSPSRAACAKDPISGQVVEFVATFGRLTDLYRDGPGGGIFGFHQQAVETALGRSFRG